MTGSYTSICGLLARLITADSNSKLQPYSFVTSHTARSGKSKCNEILVLDIQKTHRKFQEERRGGVGVNW